MRLIYKGALDEIDRKSIVLFNGLQLMIWEEGEDDNGDQDNLVVQAVIKYDEIEKCRVAQFDDDKLMHESERK